MRWPGHCAPELAEAIDLALRRRLGYRHVTLDLRGSEP